MDMQWMLLGFALALTGLTASALASPNLLVRGNPAWSACGWLASEFAPWLGAVALGILAYTLATTEVLAREPGRLAVLLIVVSALGLCAVTQRSFRTPRLLGRALRDGLGAGYLKDVPPARVAAVSDEVPRARYLRPWPRRAPEVELIPDVRYPGGHGRNVLDVYRPAKGCHQAPVLMQIHGGGWTGGDKRQQALPLLHHLAALGWVVVAPNYRLSPGARMPAHLVDCKAAFAWIRGHIAGFGGDPSFVAVTGGGSGAHLATLLALTFDDVQLQPGFEHVDTRPAACVPLYGTYDLIGAARRGPGRGGRTRWLGENLMPCPLERDSSAWEAASPLLQLRPDAPPFFVLHGSHDALAHVEDARRFVRELRRTSLNPVAYAELHGAQHGWDTLCSPRALHTVRAISRFLEWCAARPRTYGSRLGSTRQARS
jgi:acetyl esterase/lipase